MSHFEDTDVGDSHPGSPLTDDLESEPEMFAQVVDFSSLFSRTAPPPMREGTGLACEVKSFESLYNVHGDRRLLQAGSSTTFHDDRYTHSFRSALIFTRFWKYDRSLDYTELEIRSPHMKAALKTVVPAYQTHEISTRHIVIRNQPQCLFHYRTELQTYGSQLQNHEAAKHIFYLLQYLQDALAVEMCTFSTFMEDPILFPSLDFTNLWMAFRPGDLIYIRDSPQKPGSQGQIYRFVKMERCRCDVPFCPDSKWSLTLDGITTDGATFGYSPGYIHLNPYDGIRPLQDLVAFPLKYHPHEQDIRERLALRGASLVRLHGHHYRQYNGIARLVNNSNSESRSPYRVSEAMVKGRIIVDAGAFAEAQPNSSPCLSPSKQKFDPKKNEHLFMTEEDYLICTDEIAGYSLNEKRWGFFTVDLIQDVEFDGDAFQELMIDPQSKGLISSLVRVHENESLHFDDFIKGKGKGMVFLLHGEPGVGKTLAAESIADLCQKPLLRVDSGTFGTTAAALESSLSTAFKYAERWQAVALLDEADVFLEQRRNGDLTHNNLVSVFLRTLEYFKGILFLTTNRISVFDKAFKSRIHLAIHFPALSYETRLSLWKTFMSKASVASAQMLEADGSLRLVARERLNGRQIKNIVRTAFALALNLGTTIRLEHIRIGLDTMKTFEETFDGSQGVGLEGEEWGEEGAGYAGPSDGGWGSERTGSKRRRIEV